MRRASEDGAGFGFEADGNQPDRETLLPLELAQKRLWDAQATLRGNPPPHPHGLVTAAPIFVPGSLKPDLDPLDEHKDDDRFQTPPHWGQFAQQPRGPRPVDTLSRPQYHQGAPAITFTDRGLSPLPRQRADVLPQSGPVHDEGRALRFAQQAAKLQEERDRARKFGFPAMRVMVCLDGSANSWKALEAALHHRRRNDYLSLVHFVQLFDDTSDFGPSNALMRKKGFEIVTQAQRELQHRGISRFDWACIPSHNAKDAAVKYALEQRIDLIFVGSRGVNRAVQEFYPGSFTKHMINHVHSSVMLIR